LVQSITPKQLAERLKTEDSSSLQLLDVREPWEVEICALPGVTTIPMQQIPQRIAELSPELETICICHHGGRSLQVGHYLQQQGLEKITNLDGGMDAWARTVDPTVALY